MELYSTQDLFPIFEDTHSKVSLSSDKYLQQNLIARTIWLCMRMDGEIKNGGLAQLFFNLRGNFDYDLFEPAFRIIGAQKGAEFVQAFNMHLNENQDRKERFFKEAFYGNKGMAKETKKLNDDLSMRYYKEAEDVDGLILNYATENWDDKEFQAAIKHIKFSKKKKDETELIFDLVLAVEGGNIPVVKKIAKTLTNINQPDGYNNYPIIEVSRFDSTDQEKKIALCKILIEHGADLHCSNKYGETLLHKLVKKDHVDQVILYLIEQGADVNYAPNKEESVLAYAVNNLENVKLLVEQGADINQRSDLNISALGRAINRYGSWIDNKHKKKYQPTLKKVIQYLLEQGAEFYTGGTLAKHSTELFYIVQDVPLLKLLLKHPGSKTAPEFNPKYGDWNALFEAAHTGNEKAVKLFIEAGAAIHQTLSKANLGKKMFIGANLLNAASDKKIISLLEAQGLEKAAQQEFSLFMETRGDKTVIPIIAKHQNCSIEKATTIWESNCKKKGKTFENIGDKYVFFNQNVIAVFKDRKEAEELAANLKEHKVSTTIL